jgi:hypothetical protein
MSRSGVQVTMDARTGYRSWVKVTLGLIGWPLTMWWVRWRMHQQIKKFKRVVEDSLTQPGKR